MLKLEIDRLITKWLTVSYMCGRFRPVKSGDRPRQLIAHFGIM